ncbi:hypothetical protein LTS18_005267 [Coniosporium uncinatum]|uniref:Uncharacterized protein n=1 Tax=Coniosporium uncinatum TaxID=93489 RepID=A0ACC3DCS9_9PEZI|nr:hypothetical protein LTS18_005267 [Coniosporium uncinatum]
MCECYSEDEDYDFPGCCFDIDDTLLREDIREKEDLITNGVVTFDCLWQIFEPGMIIYSEDDNQHRAYKLQNGNYASDGCGRYYGLNVQYVDYDGEKFGLCGTRLSIRAFGGTAPITKLPAFPLKYHPHEEKVKASMIKRRKLFEEYAGYHFKAYDGIALGPGFCGMIKYTVNSRIIIGTYAYNRFCPNRKVSLSRFSQSNEVSYDNDEDDDMDADDCYDYYDEDNNLDTGDAAPKPPRSRNPTPNPGPTPHRHAHPARLLPQRQKWLLFNIASVHPIVWNDRAFDSLVATPEQKDLILAFAQTQADQARKTRGRDSFDDVIQGKGRGIIMLLSGTPGVGKTLTAESVAEQMQYYEGILFLTTNRVDNIDAAFKSRIHLFLQYDELDFHSHRVLWTTFLARSNKNAAPFTDEQVDALAMRELNRRQIMNVLKTVQLLATKKGEGLAWAHVDVVLRLRE